MIIEDPESFKAWLTAKLEPLCDADPAALAKYVYALVKKDKPVEELRSSMIGQLEVFLQKETQGFVNLLFRTLETQRYDLNESSNLQPPISTQVKSSGPADFEVREAYPSSSAPEEPEKKAVKEPSAAILASAQNSTSLGCAILATTTGRKDFDRHGRKCDSDKEDRGRRRGRRGSSASPDRRRTRSRSFERRRSRSRDRDRGRAWRNKSPPLRGRYDRDRRHTHSKSPERRRYSKSRSPVGNRRTRYRNRSPPRSRTRSRSPLLNKYSSSDARDRKESGVGISPRGDNIHGDTDLRLPVIPTQNLQSVVSLPSDQNSFQTRRCRDFEEKGFCMRGDLCPYDHGADPVILEDVDPLYNGAGAPTPLILQTSQPPPPITAPPPSITQVSTNNMAEYNPDAPSMEPRMWSRPQFRTGPIMRGMVRNHNGRGFPHQRELINVVTPHFRHSRPAINQDFNNSNHVNRPPLEKQQNFDFTRLGPNRVQTRPPVPQHNVGGNTSLHLKKVPPGVNDITLLNNHFSKFGKIVNIQVAFEGDPEAALITFSTHAEANCAYKSTEAVLNNRFIRVFWYMPSNNNENNKPKTQTQTPVTAKPSVLERLGAPPQKVLHNIQPSAVQQEEKVTVVNNSITKTLYIPSAMKKEIPVAPVTAVITNAIAKENTNDVLKKKIEEVALAKKKQEEARLKLNADIRKRKQELLEKQINQQKILIQRVEAGNVSEQQKKSFMSTIKELQESIESIRKDLENSVKANITAVSKRNVLTKEQQVVYRKTKEEILENPLSGEEEAIADETSSYEQTTRELLDAELDLLNSQHEGKDTTELRKKVIELKKKAALFAVPATRGSFRGRIAIRARGRGRGRGTTRFVATSLSAYDHNVVDHRPTKILISGYEQDDKDEVLKHFEVFGEILDYISDDAIPSLVLNYKSRKDAEKAILKGRNFHDRLLSVTWATPNNSIRGGIPTKPPTPTHRQVMVLEDEENIEEAIEEAEDEEEDLGLLTSPVYLIHDDDEEEEDEERSWRR